MERVWIIGCSGSGKSTLARQLGERLDLPRYELDGLFHQPGWQPMPDDEFRAHVDEIIVGDRWILDGNYFIRTKAAPVGRVQTVVWFDLPRSVTTHRIVGRTLRRVLRREELWNGNREPWSNLYSLDPEKNIIVWSWSQHPVYRKQYTEAVARGAFGDADIVHLTSTEMVDRWLHSVAPA